MPFQHRWCVDFTSLDSRRKARGKNLNDHNFLLKKGGSVRLLAFQQSYGKFRSYLCKNLVPDNITYLNLRNQLDVACQNNHHVTLRATLSSKLFSYEIMSAKSSPHYSARNIVITSLTLFQQHHHHDTPATTQSSHYSSHTIILKRFSENCFLHIRPTESFQHRTEENKLSCESAIDITYFHTTYSKSDTTYFHTAHSISDRGYIFLPARRPALPHPYFRFHVTISKSDVSDTILPARRPALPRRCSQFPCDRQPVQTKPRCCSGTSARGVAISRSSVPFFPDDCL